MVSISGRSANQASRSPCVRSVWLPTATMYAGSSHGFWLMRVIMNAPLWLSSTELRCGFFCGFGSRSSGMNHES